MSFEQPPARVLVDGSGVVLIDDITPVADAILLPGSAALNGRVEQVNVGVQRKLTQRGSEQHKHQQRKEVAQGMMVSYFVENEIIRRD